MQRAKSQPHISRRYYKRLIIDAFVGDDRNNGLQVASGRVVAFAIYTVNSAEPETHACQPNLYVNRTKAIKILIATYQIVICQSWPHCNIRSNTMYKQATS